MSVDLNIDLGELDGEPEELYTLATVANIACGGHAGTTDSMRRSIGLARRHGARLAAHPSYPDPAHFGRVRMSLSLSLLYESVHEQVSTLARLAEHDRAPLWGVKLHGALYHDAASDRELADAVLDAVVAAVPTGLVVVGPAGQLEEEARARGLDYAHEGFVDRRYRDDGALVPRSEPGALLDDPAECADQALRLARRGDVDTLCVHGDGPHAIAIARAARAALERDHLLRARSAA